MPTDPETQLERFRDAVELLGGSRATARGLDVAERTMLRLVAGEARLHAGYLQDISTLLVAHAARCMEVRNDLTPLFPENLTEDQLRKAER